MNYTNVIVCAGVLSNAKYYIYNHANMIDLLGLLTSHYTHTIKINFVNCKFILFNFINEFFHNNGSKG